MATLILGTVGRVFAGPIGGIFGAAVGGLLDRSLFGGGRPREQGRISNPQVQSAAYGEPIPIIVGRMRTAGNLIWTSGIREEAAAGGGKRSGPATTSYSYSASFAVGLVARPILGVGRIWADGKVIRDADGAFLTPVTMRLHDGGGDQPVDPLIAAVEGAGGAPAYRGLAYAVFEDLPLADYGNRIPNLTFEIIADDGAIDAGTAIGALAASCGAVLATAGGFPALTGHVAGRAGSLAEAVAPLIAISDAAVSSGAQTIVTGSGRDVVTIAPDAVDAHRPGAARVAERRRRGAADAAPGCLELSFYDSSRDYQPGLQRARRSAVPIVDQRGVSAAMSPVEAKALAIRLLMAGQLGRTRQTLRLSWRHVGLVPGMLVRIGPAAEAWRIREARFENFVVSLDVERTAADAAPAGAAARPADGGRALVFDDQPAGPTQLLVLDLPPLPGQAATTPRLWIAGNGAGAGWRRAGVAISSDNGVSYDDIGTLEGGTVIGTTLTALADAAPDAWDRRGTVDVELLSGRDWLEGRPEGSVLAGGNLALVGRELIQFATAESIGERRFRLSGLLRGRRGTEAETAGHGIGERFVLIEPGRMLAFDPPVEMLGRAGRARPRGRDDEATAPVLFTVGGAALRPLSPAHLTAQRMGDDLVISWTRRSRSGFGWTDFVDAPLGESSEVYLVTVRAAGMVVHEARVTEPRLVVPAVGSAAIDIEVMQLSADTGPGAPAIIRLDTIPEDDL
ncbi:phage tail baseplate protein [Polymorphobacter fuscus]|uniref:Uncharacterized protein n=1 Tax=Sandarakinorhabdus fusca TaxID=1439888 RepID=A0A7C9GN77_9SPHN|nr:phage tail protein [Polymorphobacter fuscus]KAB7648189.1 hypothetical protein F9290_00220 [Polymorphobacter fuscus]MQT15690.1 hypothetical protein [Polymorphobacter fuscus]NJC08039.1 hypothetical protein [Polymorphobacter fuscus]